jgi:hypothetical protein
LGYRYKRVPKHNDLSPSNIMMDGDNPVIIVAQTTEDHVSYLPVPQTHVHDGLGIIIAPWGAIPVRG